MPSTVQRNVGRHISRNYPVVDFLRQVWKLDTDDLPEDRKLNLPRPIRRVLLRFKPETLRREDINNGLPPSRLAVAAAQFALEGVDAGTFGLMQHGAGRWEDVTRFEDDQVKWQSVLCIIQLKKEGPREADENNAESSSQARRKIANDENDFATRLMFLFNSNLRSWVTGILVQGTQVSFWYADRMGVIVSSRFDCIEQPNLLYLAGLAIGSSSRHSLGISSLASFMIHTSGDRERIVETDMDFRYSYIGLPRPILDSGEVLDEDEVLFFGHSNWKMPDVAPSQLVGRGTVVVPCGAACTEAEKRFGARKTSVLKLAWAAVTAPIEDTTVRLVRRRLRESRPDMLAHVTELKASVTLNMEQMEIPRADMFILEEQRVLRVQLLERYASLEMVQSVEDFKTCFLDAVEAHHWVYETSGILQRDISADNIMIRRINGVQRGVLADWDLAKPPSPRSQRPGQRFGTRPFLSADFEAAWWQGEHFYRHDLEAFMNLLAWFCACFVPSLRQVNTDCLAAWYDEFEGGDGWCRRYLSVHLDKVMEHAHPDYRVLAEDWVRPLSQYFEPVTDSTYSKLNTLHRLAQGERWGVWSDGEYSDETILAELERVSRERDEMIDYAGFMACLGR